MSKREVRFPPKSGYGEFGKLTEYARQMGANRNTVQRLGGVVRMQSLEPHIQRLLLKHNGNGHRKAK